MIKLMFFHIDKAIYQKKNESKPQNTITSKSAPAKIAALRSQFFKFAFFNVATLKLTPAIILPSKTAPRRLTPKIFNEYLISVGDPLMFL